MQKNKNRDLILSQLLKKKTQRQASILLERELQKNQELAHGLNHNKFGAFCLTANTMQKAIEHLTKAKDLIGKYLPCSNVYMNLGNYYAQLKNYKEASKYFQQVLLISPHREGFQNTKGDIVYSGKINSFEAYVDAHINLAVMLVQLDKVEDGLKYCKRALQLQPNNNQAHINFTDFLRQVGKKDQAIQNTWNNIILYTRKCKDQNYQGFKPIKINSWQPNNEQVDSLDKQITILTVKWGTRYDAAYVNKLYCSIKRNTTWKVKFYCYTEDPKGLHEDIEPIELQKGWTKWWGKVTLFGAKIPGRKFYIDLDMVITGNLDKMFSYKGQFATLRTDDLVCEKNHKGGYNSSVMMWQGDKLQPVYDALKQNFQSISKFIVRFDFWLQMTIQNADYVQVVYPGAVVDYLAEAQQKPPATSSVVCFARKPKPDDYPSEWIKQYWKE